MKDVAKPTPDNDPTTTTDKKQLIIAGAALVGAAVVGVVGTLLAQKALSTDSEDTPE